MKASVSQYRRWTTPNKCKNVWQPLHSKYSILPSNPKTLTNHQQRRLNHIQNKLYPYPDPYNSRNINQQDCTLFMETKTFVNQPLSKISQPFPIQTIYPSTSMLAISQSKPIHLNQEDNVFVHGDDGFIPPHPAALKMVATRISSNVEWHHEESSKGKALKQAGQELWSCMGNL